MLYRKTFDKLNKWKSQVHKKALCITGARQVGKTTIIREFAKQNYDSFAEINFATDSRACDIFAGSLDANTLIANLTAYLQKPLIPKRTLILLDEIQECPNARTAIKFLVEDGRFDYIESGSLLGVKSKDIRSYPVGFEEIYRMYPMDFEEFIIANGVQPETIVYLKKCFDEKTAIQKPIHETLCKLFYTYIVVGGMPEAVRIYIETHDIAQVILYQREILELYRLDIAKYVDGADKAKTKAVFDSIPSQLNDNNRRYMLSQVDANGRQLRYENSFIWLDDAGVALPCYNVSEPSAPLILNEKHNLFKLFMSDCGLLCASCMENIQFDILNGDLSVNLGSVLENVLAQQLKSNGFNLYYYNSKKYGELDFVIQKGMNAEIIEAKSGNDYKTHAALNKVLEVKEWNINKSYVLCKGNIEQIGNTIYLPWYEIMFLRPDELPTNLKVELDLSALNKKKWGE